MTLQNLIEILEVREKEALAYTGILKRKLEKKEIEIEELQSAVDYLCDNMASIFIEKYKKYLNDEKNLVNLRRYICSVGANNPHSGKRVHEALYKKLNCLNNEFVK